MVLEQSQFARQRSELGIYDQQVQLVIVLQLIFNGSPEDSHLLPALS